MYSKTNDFGNNRIINYINNQINSGNLLDANKEKAPTWFTSKGLQLPELVQTIIGTNNSIPENSEKVNTSDEKNSKPLNDEDLKNLGEKSYYAIQAVPDTKSKTLYIVSSFIGKQGYKKEVSQLIDENFPNATS